LLLEVSNFKEKQPMDCACEKEEDLKQLREEAEQGAA
jgi:hypothetical protein